MDDDDNQEELENVGSAEHAGANEIAETPPPTLTIGAVLDKLPKIKSGMANFEITVQETGLLLHGHEYKCPSGLTFIFLMILWLLLSKDFVIVNTPNINALLALPFKKRPVESRQQFMGLWTASKDFVRTASGARGQYQANKEQRRSKEFVWPESPQNKPGVFI